MRAVTLRDQITIRRQRRAAQFAGSEGKRAAAVTLPPASFGKRYRCHDPDSPHIGEVISVKLQTVDPNRDTLLLVKLETGDRIGTRYALSVRKLLKHYLSMDSTP